MRNQVAQNRVRKGRTCADSGMMAMTAHDEIKRRLALLEETGNIEFYVDVAKYALWAWKKAGAA